MKVKEGSVFLSQPIYNRDIDLDKDYIKLKSSPTETIYLFKEKPDDYKYNIWKHIAVVLKDNPGVATLIPITRVTENLLLNPGKFRKCNQKIR